MASVEKSLKLNPDSTVLLTQKQQLLEKQLADTRDKLSKLYDIEKEIEARRSRDGSNKQLEKQLRAIQREALNTENQIGKLEESYTSVSNKVFELSGKINENSNTHRTLRDRISDVIGRLKDFVSGNQAAAEGANVSASEINSKIEIWNRFASAVQNAAMKLFDIVSNSAQAADDLLTLSEITGVSTDTLQKFQFASELVDVPMETFQDALKETTMRLGEINDGSQDTISMFRLLGISATDANGNLRSSEEVFYDAIDALSGIENTTQRDAIALKLFGESAQNLNPLIIAGSDSLREYGQQAENAGIIMGEDALTGAAAFNDQLDVLKLTIGGITNTLGAELAQSFTDLLVAITPVLTGFAQLLSLIAGIPAPILYAIITIGTLIVTGIRVMSTVSSITGVINTMNPAMWKTVGIIMAIITALIILVALITALSGKKDDIQQISASIGEMTNQVGASNISSSAQNGIPRYASGTRYHSGGVAFITEFAPEQLSLPNGTNMVVMPRGTRVNPNVSSGRSGGDTYNITIDAKNVREFNDIVKMAQNARRQRRAM